MLDPVAEARRRLNLARRFYDEGRAGEAIAVAKTSLAVVKQARGCNYPDIADVFIELSILHERLSQYDNAEWCAKRSIVITEAYSRDDEKLVRLRVRALGCLATVERVKDHLGGAEVLYRSALELAESGTWPSPADLVDLICGLGAVYQLSSRFTEAEGLYREALAMLGEERGGSAGVWPAVVWHSIAELDLVRGRFASGERYARGALDLRERQLGSNHPTVANDRVTLASLLAGQGKLDIAEKLFRRAISTFEQVLPTYHYDLAVACEAFGMLMAAKGNMAAAGRLTQRALDIKTKILGRNHPEVAQTMEVLAQFN